ncbi:hypothetical protein NFI96_016655, partial [Prochilodus magdalenae]
AMNSKDTNKKTARIPKCVRCRNHGFAVELKGHSGKCQFLACACWKCSLITERTKIMAKQRGIRKSQPDDGDRPTDTSDPAHFPWKYILTEMPQNNTYSGEWFGTALPFQLSSHFSDSYVYPAFLVSLQLPPTGTLKEAVGFPYLPPSVQAYSPEPGVPPESLVSYYTSYPSYPWVWEECIPKPHHYTLSNGENNNGPEVPSSQLGHDQGITGIRK